MDPTQTILEAARAFDRAMARLTSSGLDPVAERARIRSLLRHFTDRCEEELMSYPANVTPTHEGLQENFRVGAEVIY